MNKIFQDAKDKYVTAVMMYPNLEDSKIYGDAEFKTTVSADEILDAFLKGVLLFGVGNDFAKPTIVKADGSSVIVGENEFVPSAIEESEASGT